jgi:CBS domain-containing protein
VTDDDLHIAGIISERDIVRLLAERGPEALDDLVSQVMTRRVVTCGRDDTVSDIMECMTRGKFRHIPVVDHADRLIGIVSIGDAVKARLSLLEHEHHALREYIATA